MTTRHAVLLTYGEPPEPRYLDQLRYSWRILLGLTRTVAAIPAVALPMIALARASRRRREWRNEGYRSPLEAHTRAQARELQQALGPGWRVHVAWEFRDPLLAAVLDAIPANEPVEVVPMYAADSAFTHALSRAVVARGWARRPAPVRVRPPLDPAALARVQAAFIKAELARRGVRPGPDWALALAAHGTLMEPPKPIDTGREATERLCSHVARLLARDFGLVVNGWLNHTRGGRWTEPAMPDALRAVREAGFKKVAYFPYGFLADNAETELEGKVALRGETWDESVLLPSLNDDAGLVELLAADLVAGTATDAVETRTPVAAEA